MLIVRRTSGGIPGAAESVRHVSNAIYKRYPTYDLARSRFLLAQSQGIVRALTAIQSGMCSYCYSIIALTCGGTSRACSEPTSCP